MLHLNSPPTFPENGTQVAPTGLQAELAQQVRAWRARRGMTRRVLAQQSGLSERFLADVESARGNASLQTVERIAAALNVPPVALFVGTAVTPDDADALEMAALLQPLLPAQRERVMADLKKSLRKLLAALSNPTASNKLSNIALIGLRGAGKSTLGARLAALRGVPFIELDREIEREAGAALHEVLLNSGQAAFRQLEQAALLRILNEQGSGMVIATGGSLVSERATYQLLLAQCTTVWLKALPEEHMARVIAQGDMRPMHGNRAAMDDLQRILASRAADYGRADHTLDTAGQSVDASLAQLNSLLSMQNKGTP